MPGWLVAVIIVVVVAVVVFAVLAMLKRRKDAERSARLRDRFGPEYDRTLDRSDSEKEAERDLERRAEQRERLTSRPLSPESRERYSGRWERSQALFVDDPTAAIGDADRLVREVMEERGYPVDDFDRRADDISVDHPHLVEHFRGAASIAHRSRRESISTEDQRQAMVHYRRLFEELLVVEQPTAQQAPTTQQHQPVEQARPVQGEQPPAERTVGERPR
jgi:hypothetical protein